MRLIRRFTVSCLLHAVLLTVFLIPKIGGAQNNYEVIVQLKPQVNPNFLFSNSSKTGIHSIMAISKAETIAASMNVIKQTFSTNLNKKEFIAQLRGMPEILSAQFNEKVYLRAEVLPNDVYFNQQWNLRNIGQIGGKIGADCKASFAWGLPWRRTNALGDTLVVAVIDDVVDTNISEVNWFRNKMDIPNNGIDEDSNGYIDDHYGWNTITNNGDVQAPSPGYYHGSHVCGIIGAKGNNDTGIAGIHWGVKVLPVVGANVSDVSDIIQAYNYIIDQKKLYLQTNGAKGAYIVATNSSFGLDNSFPVDQPLWCAMYDSMGKYGILSIGATTNALSDVDVMGDIPSTCASDFLIMTTSSNFADQHTTRGYGKNAIDISAPGEGIYSTNPSFGFSAKSGTSFAAPHLAGAVSFLFSTLSDSFVLRYRKDMPTNVLLIKKALMEGVDTIPALSIRNRTSGRLNIYKAALKLNEPAKFSVNNFKVNSPTIRISKAPDQIRIEWTNNMHKTALVDLRGKKVYERILTGEQSILINKENYSSGIYLLIFEEENGNRITEKINW